MEYRKVQLTGGSTLTISLPKQWTKRAGISPGDRLAIIPQKDLSLHVVPRLEEEHPAALDATLTVGPQEDPEAALRRVIAHYLVGYDIIRIHSVKNRLPIRLRTLLKETIRNKFIGTEIVEESSEKLVLQAFLGHMDFSIEGTLNRMHILSSIMHKEAIESIQNLDRELLADLVNRDNDIDRLYLFTVRLLKKAMQDPHVFEDLGIRRPRDALGYRLVSKSLERIADHAAAIAENALELPSPPDQEVFDRIVEMYRISDEGHKQGVLSLFKLDQKFADRSFELVGRLPEMEERIMQEVLGGKTDLNFALPIRMILESNRRIGEYGADIAEIAINMIAREPS
ncbi:MAG: phosphate uptake regulator PhoU [Candidatus Bathyarchaeota archaeon]|nr:MAG: phosphate uptake regulator PhoU [Candidatus Bathyarchaeota archaeon]